MNEEVFAPPTTHENNNFQLSSSSASMFSPKIAFNTSEVNTGQFYYAYYLSHWNITCGEFGLNSFHLQYKYESISVNYGYYNIKCVSPGFNITSSSSSRNIKAIKGGVTPVANIKFFQYLSPEIANCSSVGGALTKLQWTNQNSYLSGGYSFTCGMFGSFSLSSCRTVVNPATTIGYTSYSTGNMNFLDRQYVSCHGDEALQSIKWTYNGDKNMTGQYVYTCCQYVPSCPVNYYFSKGECIACGTGLASLGGVSASCYPASFIPTLSPSHAPVTVSPSSVAPITVIDGPLVIQSFSPSLPQSSQPTRTMQPSVVPSGNHLLTSTTTTQTPFTQSSSFVAVIVIAALVCLILTITAYYLHKRWSLQSHSNQLWDWVTNDLGGEVMVMIRGSRRLRVSKDSVRSASTNGEKKSFHMTQLATDKSIAEPVLHEGLL